MEHASTSLIFLLMISAALSAQLGNEVLPIRKSSELFAAKIYEILGTSPNNILFSPYSLHTVMALAQSGARGTTLDQMSSVLNLPSDVPKLEQLFSDLQKSLRTPTTVAMSTANKIYVRDDVKLSGQFKNTTVSFDAEVEEMNVIEPATVAEKMNHWVEKKTNGKIKEIISKYDIVPDTVMVLINALYFKGRWNNAFIAELTRKMDFHLESNQTVKVDMMYSTGSYKISLNKELDATFLDLPYTDPNFVLTVILPHQTDGLKHLIKNINKVFEPQPMREEDLVVFLPKFIIEDEIQFKEVLQKMGMTEAFSNADFRGLTESERSIMITKVIQKTFMEVNEEGTEAAAASAAILSDRVYSPPVTTFLADRPFMFMLRHKPTGTILFLGHYTNIKKDN